MGLSYGGLVMLALFALAGVFLHRTRTGNAIYVVGGDPRGARLLGVSVPRTMMLAYGISGAGAALTGVYLVSRMGSGDPWRGEGFDLASITPVVVGGTALSGGRGGPLGTLLGVYLISLLNNILNFLDVSTFYQWIVQGTRELSPQWRSTSRRGGGREQADLPRTGEGPRGGCIPDRPASKPASKQVWAARLPDRQCAGRIRLVAGVPEA